MLILMTSPSFMIVFSCYFSRYQTYWTSNSCTYDKKWKSAVTRKDYHFLYIFPRNLDISYKCLPPEYRSGTKIFLSPHFLTNRG